MHFTYNTEGGAGGGGVGGGGEGGGGAGGVEEVIGCDRC